MNLGTEAIKQKNTDFLKDELSQIIDKISKQTPPNQLEQLVRSIDQLRRHINLLADEEKTINEYVTEFNKNKSFPSISTEKLSKLPKDLTSFSASWRINFEAIIQLNSKVTAALAQVRYIPEIKQKIIALLKSDINYLLNEKKDIEIRPSKLADFEAFLDKMLNSELTIEEYISNFNENKFLPSIDDKKFLELSKKLKSEAEKVGNASNVCKVFWGKEITQVFTKIKDEIKKIKAFSSFTLENGEATCLGYNLKISDVTKFIASKKSNVKHIRIFACSEIMIDNDIVMPSCNMTIIAPKWSIQGSSIISLKGQDALASRLMNTVSAGSVSKDGQPGTPGLPGSDGGNFFGIGQEFSNLKNLRINLDGGNGGPGQKGGNGAKGQDNTYTVNVPKQDELRPLIEWLKYVDNVSPIIYSKEFKAFNLNQYRGKDLFDKIENKWQEAIHAITQEDLRLSNECSVDLGSLRELIELKIKKFQQTTYSSHEQQKLRKSGSSSILTKKLSVGQIEERIEELSNDLFKEPISNTNSRILESSIGGKAGKGGSGGLGGKAGLFQLISTNSSIDSYYKPKAGENGLDGEDGLPGEGGKVTLNVMDLTKKSSCCISFNAPLNTTYNLFAPPGSLLTSVNSLDQNSSLLTEITPNIRLSLIDYEVLFAEQSRLSQGLSKSFCHQLKTQIITDDNIENFAMELLKLEEYISRSKAKLNFPTFYNSLEERIAKYISSLVDVNDIKVAKYLYAVTLTKISQLGAATKPMLVINIEKFLEATKENINKLHSADKTNAVRKSKDEYIKEINSKIREAKSFVLELVQDIDNSSNMMDEHFKCYLKEIEQDIKAISSSSIDLQGTKLSLQNAIVKTTLFATLGMMLSTTGSAFGPAGLVVAGILQSGINLLDNPDLKGPDELVEKLQHLSSSWDSKLQSGVTESVNDINLLEVQTASTTGGQFSNLLHSVQPAVLALQSMSKNIKTEKNKLATVTTAIKQAETLVNQLQGHKSYMVQNFRSRLEEITDQIKDMQKNLENKSAVAIEFNKLEMQKFFQTVKAEISKIIGKQSEADGFIKVINKMIEALETSMNIHEYIQEYKNQIKFAEYIAHVTNPNLEEAITDSSNLNSIFQKLDAITGRNITLEQYYSAISLIKQWSFPFVKEVLSNIDTQPNFLTVTDKEFISKINAEMTSITQDVSKDKTYISSVDHLIKEDSFIEKPFFTWSYENHEHEIRQLLNGQSVFLYADASNVHAGKAAIKFQEIRLNISIKGLETEEAKLKELLKNYTIEMQHSGNSYYRYAGNTYGMNHEAFKISFSEPFSHNSLSLSYKKIYKCSQDNPMFSPYTWWAIRIHEKQSTTSEMSEYEDRNVYDSLLLRKFNKLLPKFELQLIGNGRYIDETQISYQQHQSFKVDSYYNRVIDPMPKFILEEEIKKFTSQPNAFNQRETRDYKFQASDMAVIQSQLMKSCEHVVAEKPIDESLNSARLLTNIVTNLENKPVMCLYNDRQSGWGVLTILYDNQGSKIALYKNLSGYPTQFLSNQLKELGITRLITARGNAAQINIADSGTVVLKDMIIIIDELKNKSKLINDFYQFAGYPHSESYQDLCKEFALTYVAGIYETLKNKNPAVSFLELIGALNIQSNDIKSKELAKKVYDEKDQGFYQQYIAAQNSNKTALMDLLSQNVDVNTVDNSGKTFLHWAAIHGDIEAASFLLTKGANIKAKDKDERTPLHLASKKGNAEVVEFLLNNDADVGEYDQNCDTPLTFALANGHLEVVKILLEGGADIDIYDNEESPLYVAISNNQLDCLELLLDKCAESQEYTSAISTSLRIAVEISNIRAVKFLLAKGADVNLATKYGITTLHIAAKKGSIEIARLLLDKKADINSLTQEHGTPLHTAVQRGDIELVQLFLDKGANVNASIVSRSEYGITPLHIAVQRGELDLVKLLIDEGANVDAMSRLATPLYLAGANGFNEIVGLLLNKGAKLDLIDEKNGEKITERIFDIATRKGYQKVISLIKAKENDEIESKEKEQGFGQQYIAAQNSGQIALIELFDQNVDIDVVDELGRTFLHWTALYGDTETAKLLLAKGAHIIAKDKDGRTPLHLASKKGNVEVVEFLLNNKVDIDAEDKCRKTPLNFASENGHLEVVKLLLDRNAYAQDTDLYTAISNNHLESAALLFDKLDEECKCEFDRSQNAQSKFIALRIAAQTCNPEAVNLLLSKGMSIDTTNKSNYTALHIAAWEGDTKMAELLLEKGASLTALTESSSTPLHLAVKSRKIKADLVQILIDRGASTEAKDKDGKTPLSIAIEKGCQEVVSLIKAKEFELEAGQLNIVDGNIELDSHGTFEEGLTSHDVAITGNTKLHYDDKYHFNAADELI